MPKNTLDVLPTFLDLLVKLPDVSVTFLAANLYRLIDYLSFCKLFHQFEGLGFIVEAPIIGLCLRSELGCVGQMVDRVTFFVGSVVNMALVHRLFPLLLKLSYSRFKQKVLSIISSHLLLIEAKCARIAEDQRPFFATVHQLTSDPLLVLNRLE
jgi:hypothetical protein